MGYFYKIAMFASIKALRLLELVYVG